MRKRSQKEFLIFFVILAALMQATFFCRFRVAGVKPDILLIIVIFSTFYFEGPFCLKTALFAGFIGDVLSGGIFGLNILTFGLCGFILPLYGQKVYRENIPIQLFICFSSILAVYTLYYLASRVFLPLAGFIEAFKMVILPTALYSTFIFGLLCIFLKKSLGFLTYENCSY